MSFFKFRSKVIGKAVSTYKRTHKIPISAIANNSHPAARFGDQRRSIPIVALIRAGQRGLL